MNNISGTPASDRCRNNAQRLDSDDEVMECQDKSDELEPPFPAREDPDIGNWLECPVCNEIPREGFIFQCTNGHCVVRQNQNNCFTGALILLHVRLVCWMSSQVVTPCKTMPNLQKSHDGRKQMPLC